VSGKRLAQAEQLLLQVKALQLRLRGREQRFCQQAERWSVCSDVALVFFKHKLVLFSCGPFLVWSSQRQEFVTLQTILRTGYPTGQMGAVLTTSSTLNQQRTTHPKVSTPYHEQNMFGHYRISHPKVTPDVLLCGLQS